MSKTELIRKIKQLHRRKQPLNINRVRENHPELLEAAYSFKPFLGWRQALEKARLSYDTIITEIEEYVECPYCGFDYRALPTHLEKVHEVSCADLLAEFPDAHIIAEASRPIRSHNPELPHWESVWSREYILDRTWQWYLTTGKCHMGHIADCDPTLPSAAVNPRYFDCWDDVLRALGLDPAEIRLSRPVEMTFDNLESLLEAIREHHASGKPLSSTFIQRDYPHLSNGARKFSLGWPEAVKAAGLEKVHKKEGHLNRITLPPMSYPEKCDVLDALRQRHTEGLSLSCSKMLEEDPELARCFRYHFKHWKDGMREAGLVRAHQKDVRKSFKNRGAYPTDESVLKAIRELHRKGHSLSSNIIKDTYPALLAQAYIRFGSWPEARERAGIDFSKLPKPIRARNHKPLNKSTTIKALKERHQKGLSLLQSKIKKDNPHLMHCVYRHFDKWADAMKAAGLARVHKQQVDKVRKDAGQRLRIDTYPDKESVLKALHERAGNNLSILGKVLLRENSHLHYRITREFGKVTKAVRAAGLQKEHERQHKLALKGHIKYPAPENVLDEIRNRTDKGKCILGESAHEQDASLYQKALLWFGTWVDACREAGVENVYQETIKKRAELRKKHG